MSTEISYKDLKIDMLSDQALALLCEFVSTWHANTGELIDVDADDAVMQIFQNAKKSNDRRLRSIYLHIRAEFTNILENSLTHSDALFAEQVMSHISKGRTFRLRGREFVS